MLYFNNNHNLKNKRYTHGANVTQPFANEQNAKQVFYKRLADVCKRSLLGGDVWKGAVKPTNGRDQQPQLARNCGHRK